MHKEKDKEAATLTLDMVDNLLLMVRVQAKQILMEMDMHRDTGKEVAQLTLIMEILQHMVKARGMQILMEMDRHQGTGKEVVQLI